MRKAGFPFFLLFPLLLSSISFALIEDDQNMRTKQFIANLKDYFYSYYSQVVEKKVIKSKRDVFKELSQILRETQISIEKVILIEKDENLGVLTDLINRYLEDERKGINLFIVDGSGVVNCWLGDLVKEEIGAKKVWGKDVKFKVKVLNNLVIQDFTYFSSEGKEAIDVGVRGDIIYYNLDAYKMRAGEVWDLLLKKTVNKNKHYNPLQSNRLRKRLCYKTWGDLFLDGINKNEDLKEARQDFIERAVDRLKENSLFHEAGHIYAQEYLGITDEVEEEILAFLTELRYGPLPYESLDVIVSSRWRSFMGNYKLAGDELISSLISYIEHEQERGNQDYKRIVIEGTRSKKSIDNLHRLAAEQIRQISEYIYKERYQDWRNKKWAIKQRF